MHNDLPANGLTAFEAASKIRDGLLTSLELTTACLERIGQSDGDIKAWAYIDKAAALERAKELDQMRASGKPLGALHGLPIGLKDIIETRDMPTQYGSSVFDDHQPDHDAKIVDRLREEGAVILGKTVTTEFAFMHPAETCNPHNPVCSPGGSSAGSAAAVAAYHTPLAIGSQTNGSVIRPASYCGTFGFKPSRGVLSRHGVLQTSATLDQLGVFARCLEDLAMLTDAMAFYDPADDASYPRARPKMLAGVQSEPPIDPDIVWIDLPFFDRLSEEAREGMDEVINALGERVERINAPSYFSDLPKVHETIYHYELIQHLGDVFDGNDEKLSDTIKPVLKQARAVSTSTYHDALGVMSDMDKFYQQFFLDYDAILTPSATGEAPQLSQGHTGDPVCSTLWTLNGLPCISMPLLTNTEGLPIGVQLVGAREEDDRLFRTASWIMKELG